MSRVLCSLKIKIKKELFTFPEVSEKEIAI
jgi:hypothetical protein